MGGDLNRSGERFQNNAASLSGFTGFVGRPIRVKRVCGSKNIRVVWT